MHSRKLGAALRIAIATLVVSSLLTGCGEMNPLTAYSDLNELAEELKIEDTGEVVEEVRYGAASPDDGPHLDYLVQGDDSYEQILESLIAAGFEKKSTLDGWTSWYRTTKNGTKQHVSVRIAEPGDRFVSEFSVDVQDVGAMVNID